MTGATGQPSRGSIAEHLQATGRSPQAAALVLLLVFAWLMRAGHTLSSSPGRSAQAPRQLGLWVGTPMAMDHRSLELLGTDDVSLAEYHLGQEPPVWFAQVAGFGNRATFHPPELCYVGSDFRILEREPVSVFANGQERQVMRLVLGQDGARYETWYWFTADGRVTSNYYRQQLWLLMDSIRRKPMSGTLVRVSTPLDSPAQTRRRLLAFVTSLDQVDSPRNGHGL